MQNQVFVATFIDHKNLHFFIIRTPFLVYFQLYLPVILYYFVTILSFEIFSILKKFVVNRNFEKKIKFCNKF